MKNCDVRLLGFIAVMLMSLLLAGQSWASAIKLDVRPGQGVTGQGMISDYFAPLKNTNLDTPIYYLDSGKPGATMLIMGGTHANELAGSVTALLMVENFKIEAGRLIVMPYTNRSGLSVRDTRKGIKREHQITTRLGQRVLLYGDRRTDEFDQGAEDPDSYINPVGYELKNGKEARNLNRAYPGKADGTATEQLAYTIIEMIKKEKIDLCIDYHEARTPDKKLNYDKEYGTGGGTSKAPLAYTLISHPRGIEVGAYALLGMEEDTNKSFRLEESNPSFRGLSHLEIGQATDCLSFISETPNPGQDKWRSNPDVINDNKYPLAHRVGMHLRIFYNLATSYSDLEGKAFSVNGLPGFDEIMKNDVGFYLN